MAETAEDLAERFETHRAHLRAVAYRMLGSVSDADDAVQQTWLRLAGTDAGGIQNLRGWLTTVIGRICLDMLRARVARREDSLDAHVPDPVVSLGTPDPEQEALLADSVGLALLVVLDTLAPAERLAFVLHDVFAVPFDQIAAILDRSPNATKQLASRARNRLRGATAQDADPRKHRDVIDAFLAASRDGDFDALIALLDPQVVLRADAGDGPLGPSRVIVGAHAVAGQARRYASLARYARRALVDGAPGIVAMPAGRPVAVLAITIRDGRIAEINILADPERLQHISLSGE